jgi:lysozyme
MTVQITTSLVEKIINFLLNFLRRGHFPPKGSNELIKKWEGLKLEAYQDGGGVWTIGWGHTKTAQSGMKISRSEAERLLKEDLKWVEKAIKDLVKVKLSQNELDALSSFVFNVGATQFRSSTLLKKLNRGDKTGAANELLRWVYDNGKVVQGLKNRREDERSYFLLGG